MDAQHPLHIAVVGSRNSGKTALAEALRQEAAWIGKPLVFEEIHDLDALHGHTYAAVLQVVDSTHLEESLLLTPHIIDEQEKIVVALNRYDQLLDTGHSIDLPVMQDLMGVPLALVSAGKGRGIGEVLHLLEQTAAAPAVTDHPVYHAWEQHDEDAYRGYVHGVLMQTLLHPKDDKHCSRLERIDKILTNKWTGFPILAVILFVVFECTFSLGEPLQDLLQKGIDALYGFVVAHLSAGWFTSLLSDGIIQGVGSLLTALPNIIILFFFLSVMEDTGYMARVAFLMDGMMHRLGLHGRSFIPMLMGFDCNVPAIMAAKDIKDPKDRALTMLMVPFMSCSARLPVYILFIDAFFENYKAVVLLSLYLLGILLSFLFAFVMKKTKWFRKPADDMVNELPDFRLPTWKSIGGHIWYRVSDFLKKISTVVLCASVIIWALEYFPAGDLDHIETSWLAAIGQFIAPVMQPLGFDWKLSVCLLTGLPAKEAIAATFAILFGGDLAATTLTPVSAYAFLVFTLLYFPCVATIATIRREINWKWSTFTVVNSIVVAWLASFAVYQVGTLLFSF